MTGKRDELMLSKIRLLNSAYKGALELHFGAGEKKPCKSCQGQREVTTWVTFTLCPT